MNAGVPSAPRHRSRAHDVSSRISLSVASCRTCTLSVTTVVVGSVDTGAGAAESDLRPKDEGLPVLESGTGGGCGVSCQMCGGGRKTTEGWFSI